MALLKLADRFDCQSLRDRCEAHLVNCVEIPLVDRLNSVKMYGLNDLKVHSIPIGTYIFSTDFAHTGEIDGDFQ
jgi:hypothetical protein